MKKLLMIALTGMLAARASGFNVGRLTVGMTQGGGFGISVTNGSSGAVQSQAPIILDDVKPKNPESPVNLAAQPAAPIPATNVGVAGSSQMLNKATTLYSLEHAKKVGNNISVYDGDSESDKADLENAANTKNIKLHYFFNRK